MTPTLKEACDAAEGLSEADQDALAEWILAEIASDERPVLPKLQDILEEADEDIREGRLRSMEDVLGLRGR